MTDCAPPLRRTQQATETKMSEPVFTEKQRKVLRCATHRWNILSGATRSGKTHISYFLALLRIREHRENNILFSGKTLNTLDRNVFDPMRRIFGNQHVSPIIDKKKVNIFGKWCYCVGANDDRAITKIQGLGLGYAYCDELTTFPENFFEMLKSRLDLPNSRCDATCNPESPSHFVKRHIDNHDLDVYNEHFTIYDNTFLAPSFIHDLENEYRGTIYFDRWILGNWVRTEGLVYPLFRRERHYLTPDAFRKAYGVHRIRYVIWGGDGANTNDATALVPVAIMDNGQAVVLEIFYHDPKVNGQLSNEQLIPYIQQYLRDMEERYHFMQNRVTFCMPIDCAAADLVLTLAYKLPAFYNVQKYTRKDIMQTTDTVNNALGRNAVVILNFGGTYNYIKRRFESGECPLVTDLEAMIWDKRNDGYDDSIPNDCADAFRYALCTYYLNPFNLWETPTMTNTYHGNTEETNERSP